MGEIENRAGTQGQNLWRLVSAGQGFVGRIRDRKDSDEARAEPHRDPDDRRRRLCSRAQRRLADTSSQRASTEFGGKQNRQVAFDARSTNNGFAAYSRVRAHGRMSSLQKTAPCCGQAIKIRKHESRGSKRLPPRWSAGLRTPDMSQNS